MSKENSKAPLTVAKGVTIAQVETTKNVIKPEVSKTLEELQKENAELKLKLSVIPDDLENKIEYFNRKKELIKKLSHLQANRDEVLKHLSNISVLAAADEFANERYFVIITSKESYNSNEVFKIGNTMIVGDVLNFILARMEVKENQLKEEIEA